MDKVEKVARAICRAHTKSRTPSVEDVEGQVNTYWGLWVSEAEAALAAMDEQATGANSAQVGAGNSLQKAQRSEEPVAWQFATGQTVEKFTGEAIWNGVIVARYQTTKGKRRYVVEVQPQGFQMIAVPEQLRAASPHSEALPRDTSRFRKLSTVDDEKVTHLSHDEEMELARKIMRENHNILKQLKDA